MLDLQRDAGNAAVTELVLQRRAGGDTPRLRKGARGPAVVKLQDLLNDSGLAATVAVDGRFGAHTRVAVRRAQAKSAIDVDGIVGPVTWSALRKAVEKRASAAAAGERAGAAAKRADAAWSLAAQAHSNGRWDAAMEGYAEVVTQAADAGNQELVRVAAVRLREARLKRPPTPYQDVVAGAGAATDERTGETADPSAAKRALADAQVKEGKDAEALANYLAAYAGKGGGATATVTEDAWSIAGCLHRLGRFDEAVSWYRQASAGFSDADSDSFAVIVAARTREALSRTAPTPTDQLKARYMEQLRGGGEDNAARTKLQARLTEGEERYRAGDYDGALAVFHEVWKAAATFDVGMGDVMYVIALCHHRLGRYQQAIEFYRQAREANRGRNWFIASLERLGGDSREVATDAQQLRDSCSKGIASAMRHQQP